MQFIDLDRHFWPIKKDEEIDDTVGRLWGKRIGGWLDWNDILEKRRVVLLAEASSGKTEEFRYKSAKLRAEGKVAFFVRIEDLADDGFEASLDYESIKIFSDWKRGYEDAFFFLDSVDEARLNRKSFEGALIKFGRAVGDDINRSRIFISCRVTDWKGAEDRRFVESNLPVPENTPKSTPEPDSALLDPMFSCNDGTEQNDEDESPKPDLAIVRLAPLDNEQQSTLAEAAGVKDANVLLHEVWQRGLENFAERPGDFIDLATYWRAFGKFGSLCKMTEHSVTRKLAERDPHRPDNIVLSSKKARAGAERIAAALTFGKTLTLRTPAQEPDPDLTAGALDPVKILPEWNDGERNALLRRAIFSPATYGRVRFHHRTTQEYLTAKWFDHLLQRGCPRSEIFKILFVDIYGVRTVVPSLKPVAAWLGLWHEDIREEILKRDPIILIRSGDPGSLPIEARQRLLRAYAEKHEAGDVADDSIDHRALWMFADPALADTIREVWNKSRDLDLRGDLLRLIDEGSITDCADLAEAIASSTKVNIFHRTVAVRALIKCKQQNSVSNLANRLLTAPHKLSAQQAAYFALEMFPTHLSVEQLLTLIAKTKPQPEDSTVGFGYALDDLWSKCPDNWRLAFASGIAKLALSKPFIADYQRISKKYRFLARNVESIAWQLVTELGDEEPEPGLIRLLMVIERVDHTYSMRDQKEPLEALVRQLPKLQRALFWADVEEVRKNRGKKNKRPTGFWDIHFSGRSLWRFQGSDLDWLFDDLKGRSFIDDRRIALSAIVAILRSEDRFEQEKTALAKKVSGDSALKKDLEDYLKPREESEWERDHRLRSKKYKQERTERESRDKALWREFRDKVCRDQAQLTDPKTRLAFIHNLTRWLWKRTGKEPNESPRQWALLEEAFTRKVAVAYRNGLKALWRATKPERPRSNDKSGITVKWVTIYSYAGVGVEADQTKGWAGRLTAAEAKQAALHGLLSDQGYPDWLDDLLEAHPDTVAPILKREFRREWKASSNRHAALLHRYGNISFPLPEQLAPILCDVITRSEPGSTRRLEDGLGILQRIDLTDAQTLTLKRMATKRFEAHIAASAVGDALGYLAVLFFFDPEMGLNRMRTWLESMPSDIAQSLSILIFGQLFNREERGFASCTLNKATPTTLKELVLLAYRYIRPAADNIHHGTYTPDARDHAERGRNSVLSALIHHPSGDAYRAMKALAQHPDIERRSHRFHELARGMAERAAERPQWTEQEINALEGDLITPIITGDDLFNVLLGVLGDVDHALGWEDASSKRLLKLLSKSNNIDEECVQNWLAEQLRLRSNRRIHVSREPEIADKNQPDIIVSSASSIDEVAVEVKRADSWSANELREALLIQLAEAYLKPTNRRHGVLFLTYHGQKQFWRHPDTNAKITFEQLLIYLAKIAEAVTSNSTGSVQVAVVGVDANH